MSGHGKDGMPESASARRENELGEPLLALLRAHPAGLSEYELFAALYARGDDRFNISNLRDTFSLFCSHFRLFNALYRLQAQLWAQRNGSLVISPLLVVLHPYNDLLAEQHQLDEVDALRAYYLDIVHLEQTTADDLDVMLDKFWARLDGSARRRQALDLLGLKESADQRAIKQRYRRLAMEHHPDRGGETACLQMINAAMAVLRE